MAAYSRVYDSRHLQADCQEPGSAPEPYARQSSMGYLYLSVVTAPPPAGLPIVFWADGRRAANRPSADGLLASPSGRNWRRVNYLRLAAARVLSSRYRPPTHTPLMSVR